MLLLLSKLETEPIINLYISRAFARNIVMNLAVQNNDEFNKRGFESLFAMLDEKFVDSQFNEGLDHMIKASVSFEDTELVYKHKKKETTYTSRLIKDKYDYELYDSSQVFNYLYRNNFIKIT